MASSSNLNLKTMPEQGAGFEHFKLPMKRIESAFSTAPRDTLVSDNDSGGSNNDSDRLRVEANFDVGKRRGIRLAEPKEMGRLVGFVREHRWQGHVVSVDNNAGYFTARLYEITATGKPDIEEAEFGFLEIPELMRPNVKPGALLYWDVGFQAEPSGEHKRSSVICVPSVPRLRENDLAEARARAKKKFFELGWDKNVGGQTNNERPASG